MVQRYVRSIWDLQWIEMTMMATDFCQVVGAQQFNNRDFSKSVRQESILEVKKLLIWRSPMTRSNFVGCSQSHDEPPMKQIAAMNVWTVHINYHWRAYSSHRRRQDNEHSPKWAFYAITDTNACNQHQVLEYANEASHRRNPTGTEHC